ncbi:MAG: hypothetical protein JSW20_08710 [Nitrospiraceae bacterium]|nr:MAG: hypothetical protein JSW20_08710 [Nitrospiraceae bacterium]
MNDLIKKVLFFDKAISILVVLSLVAIAVIIVTFIYASDTKADNNSLRRQLNEINSVAGTVVDIKDFVELKEKKIGLRKTKGVVSVLQQNLEVLGLKAKTIKPLDKKKVFEYMEENAELELEGADLNHIVNLLYKIESSPVPIKIKSTSMKTSFEDPDKFELKIILALMTEG